MHRHKTTYDNLFQKFLQEIGAEIYPLNPKDTFYQNNGKSTTQIDYILEIPKVTLKQIKFLEMEVKNTSEHVSVVAKLKTN